MDLKCVSDQSVLWFRRSPPLLSTLEIIYKDFGSRLFLVLLHIVMKEKRKEFAKNLLRFGLKIQTILSTKT